MITIENVTPLLGTKSTEAIAQELGVTKNQLRHFMAKNRLKNWTPELAEKAQIGQVMLAIERWGIAGAASKLDLAVDVVESIHDREMRRRKEVADSYTPERVNELRSIVATYARKMGYVAESDDMASATVIRMLEGKVEGKHLSPKIEILKYINEEYGDKGSIKRKIFDDQAHEDVDVYDDHGRGFGHRAPTQTLIQRWYQIAESIHFEDLRERVMFFLVYYLELENAEICAFMDIGLQRAIDIKKATVSKVQKLGMRHFTGS